MDDTKIVRFMSLLSCVQTFYPNATSNLTHNSLTTFTDSDQYPYYHQILLDGGTQELADQKLKQVVDWTQTNFNSRWALNIESLYESLVTDWGVYFYFKFEEDLIAFKLKWS